MDFRGPDHADVLYRAVAHIGQIAERRGAARRWLGSRWPIEIETLRSRLGEQIKSNAGGG